MPLPPHATDDEFTARSLSHLRFGWWSLLLFLTLGIVLQALHGFKVSGYLGPGYETRRLLWTLAHAHGALLGVIHVVFALTLRGFSTRSTRWHRVASPCLFASSLLLPGGFFLGGLYLYDDDPGMGIMLAPLGSVVFLLAVLVTARGAGRAESSDLRGDPSE